MKHLKLFEQFLHEGLVVPVYRGVGDLMQHAMITFNKEQNAHKALSIGISSLLKTKYAFEDYEVSSSAWMIFKNAGRGKVGPVFQTPELVIAPFVKWRKDHVNGTGLHGARTPEEIKEDRRRAQAFEEELEKKGLYILLFSEKQIPASLVDQIFPAEASGSDKKTSYKLVREIEKYTPNGKSQTGPFGIYAGNAKDQYGRNYQPFMKMELQPISFFASTLPRRKESTFYFK